MKQAIIIILLALVAMTAQAQENNYTVSGDLSYFINAWKKANVRADSMYILNDSISIKTSGQKKVKYKVEDNKFQISGTIGRPLYSKLVVETTFSNDDGEYKSTQDFPFILEPGNIKMEGFDFLGTPLNDTCVGIKHKLSDLYLSDQTDKVKEEAFRFVRQHASDPAATYVVVFSQHVEMGAKDILAMLDLCSEEVQHTIVDLAMLKQELLKEAQSPQAGDMFKDFAVEYEGKTSRLSDYVGKGQYVLVDFWASWCGSCRAEIPNLIAAYNKHKGQGLQVLGIAAWDKPEATLKAIEEEKVPYPQIINSQHIATDLYGITGIPEIILFAPDGKILRRGLRGPIIEKALAEIFGE